MSNSLRPHGLQHARLPCSLPSPGACSHLYPLSRWWHPTISSYVIPFSSCLQMFPVSGCFPVSQFSESSGQSIGASVSASVLPRIFWTWLVWFPWCPRDSQESSPAPQFKNISSWLPAFFIIQSSHLYMTTGKTTALTIQSFVGKVMSLLSNMLSRLVTAFLPRSKCLLISWLQSPSAVNLELKKMKLPKIVTAYFPMCSDHKL